MGRRKNDLSANQLSILRNQLSDEEAWNRFERNCHLKNLRPDTISFYANKLQATRTTMKEMKIDKQIIELTGEDIEDKILYLKQRIKISSINARLRGLKAYFNYLHKDKMIKKNPMENITQLRDRRNIIETLNDNEIEMIVQYMKDQKTFTAIRDYNIFLVMLSTGIRLTELSEVRIDDIDGRKLIIRNTKNLKQREVWLPKRVEEEINKYLKLRGELGHTYLFVSIDNEPLQKRSIQSRFEIYQKELKINKRFSPHTLRHTFAKRAVLSGMSSFVLAELLGHSDLAIVKRYVNFWGNEVEEQATKYNSIERLKI